MREDNDLGVSITTAGVDLQLNLREDTDLGVSIAAAARACSNVPPCSALYLKELRALFAKGRMVACAVDEEGNICALRLISMLLHATTTYSIGALTLFFSMSKFMAFEAAHWNRDMRSPWYCKVPSSQACRRLWTIKSQDDSIDRNLNVSLTHMTAPGVGDVIEFLHEFFLRTVVEIARLVDTFGRANAIVRPNSVFFCSLTCVLKCSPMFSLVPQGT